MRDFDPAYDRLGSFASPAGSIASPNVRYAFNSDRICASQRTDVMCQKATWAREEVQVEIAEQINLSSIKVG